MTEFEKATLKIQCFVAVAAIYTNAGMEELRSKAKVLFDYITKKD